MKRTLALALLAGLFGCSGSSDPTPEAPPRGPAVEAQLARTLSGHTEQVWSVAFAPDGELLASGSVDRTLRLWRVADGTVVRVLAHPEGVTSVAFSPDGGWVASGSYDKTVKLWRVPEGELLRTLSGDSECVYAVAFSPDGHYLASGSRSRTALGGLIKHVASTTGSRGKTLRLWQWSDGSLLQTLSGHSDDVHGVQFSPDGERLASASVDKTIVLWKLEHVTP